MRSKPKRKPSEVQEFKLMHARQVIIRPIISEKSYALIAQNKYTFRVHPDAHKTQIRRAVEEIFDVNVVDVRTATMKAKPKRRGWTSGRTRGWKKAVVELAPGERLELFEGAAAAE
jgi:large subunit ribosomal protein L23